MSRPTPVVIVSAILALCAADAALQTGRAADEPEHGAKTHQAPATNPTAATSTPAKPVESAAAKVGAANAAIKPAANPGPAPKSPPAGAPQIPEESASIRDDPTIAPDAKQSADNNVSFPNDI